MPTDLEREVASLCGYNDRARFEQAHPDMRKAFDHPPYPASPELARRWRAGWMAADAERETHYLPREKWAET